MFRILVADSLPEDVILSFKDAEGIAIENRAGISADELKKIFPEFDGLVVRSRTKVTAEILTAGERLKVIGRAGAGVDNIDIKEATHRGIVVMNTPGANTIAATEHTIAMMLATLRNIPAANAKMRLKEWDKKSFVGREIYHKTVGIIGLGKIGREVARRLKAFEAKVLGYDPILTPEVAHSLGVELVDFDTLLKNADIITIHAPKMPETINMLNAEKFALCRDGVVIVNCARGGLVNEEDLLSALESGKVSAAAVDVFTSEPPTDWRLVQHPHCVTTPHLGASTREAQEKVAGKIFQQIQEYALMGIAQNAVNFVSVDEAILPKIRPYFELARRLGALFNQIRESRLKKVHLGLMGSLSKFPADPIASYLMAETFQTSALKDMPHGVDLINEVNATAIAREKGVTIETTKSDRSLNGHPNFMECTFQTEKQEIRLAGSVLEKRLFRLIEFDGFQVDAELFGKLVIIVNEDVPGIIGKVGTVLGNNRINISHVTSGRRKERKLACNIFNVEGDLDAAKLREQLREIPHLNSVQLVDLKS